MSVSLSRLSGTRRSAPGQRLPTQVHGLNVHSEFLAAVTLRPRKLPIQKNGRANPCPLARF